MNFFEKEMRQMFEDDDIFQDTKFVGKTMLAKLDVPKAQMEKDMSNLSAGQKKKVLLAKSICEPMHLHIWDEPMNYIDVISRMQIEALLLEYKPTIIFVEHDKSFCENVATKIVKL